MTTHILNEVNFGSIEENDPEIIENIDEIINNFNKNFKNINVKGPLKPALSKNVKLDKNELPSSPPYNNYVPKERENVILCSMDPSPDIVIDIVLLGEYLLNLSKKYNDNWKNYPVPDMDFEYQLYCDTFRFASIIFSGKYFEKNSEFYKENWKIYKEFYDKWHNYIGKNENLRRRLYIYKLKCNLIPRMCNNEIS